MYGWRIWKRISKTSAELGRYREPRLVVMAVMENRHGDTGVLVLRQPLCMEAEMAGRQLGKKSLKFKGIFVLFLL